MKVRKDTLNLKKKKSAPGNYLFGLNCCNGGTLRNLQRKEKNRVGGRALNGKLALFYCDSCVHMIVHELL